MSGVAPTSFQKPPHKYVQFERLFGVNADIDSGTVPETIWIPGGPVIFPNAQGVVSFVSDNAADDAVGTGATSVRLRGVDDQFNEVIEDLPTDGLTPVVSTKEFLWVNRFEVLTHGGDASKTNLGLITATVGGLTVSAIRAGDGVARQAIYTVPKPEIPGTGPFIVAATVNFGRQSNVTGEFVAYTQSQENGIDAGPRLSAGEVFVNSNGSSFITVPFSVSVPIAVGTRIWFEVISVSANSVGSAAALQLGWQ